MGGGGSHGFPCARNAVVLISPLKTIFACIHLDCPHRFTLVHRVPVSFLLHGQRVLTYGSLRSQAHVNTDTEAAHSAPAV